MYEEVKKIIAINDAFEKAKLLVGEICFKIGYDMPYQQAFLLLKMDGIKGTQTSLYKKHKVYTGLNPSYLFNKCKDEGFIEPVNENGSKRYVDLQLSKKGMDFVEKFKRGAADE